MSNILLATQVLLQLATQVQQLAALVAKAGAEGRDITDAELDGLARNDDAARAALQAKIDAARHGGI